MANREGRHLLPGFDAALEDLRTNIILMGTLARRNFTNAKLGYLTRDIDHCAAVIADDEEVDLLEKQVDKDGTSILLKFQPVTFDLRRVLATIKLGSHLERLSDQAVVIARRVRKLTEEALIGNTRELHSLFDELERALIEALDAFAQFDSERSEKVRLSMEPLAERARNLDDEFTEMVESQPFQARAYINLIAVAQCLERIAYAIENIAEEAIYVSEAKDVRHPKNALEID
jgi:phosphate transport system protein